jgi:hypothetical protein
LAALFIAGLVVLTSVGKHAVLKNVVAAPPEATIAPQISKEVTKSLVPDGVAVDGKDFTIQSKQYFEGKNWLVALVVPAATDNATDPALIVMKLDKGVYITVLGPGTAFPESGMTAVPHSVEIYLQQMHRVYQDIN